MTSLGLCSPSVGETVVQPSLRSHSCSPQRWGASVTSGGPCKRDPPPGLPMPHVQPSAWPSSPAHCFLGGHSKPYHGLPVWSQTVKERTLFPRATEFQHSHFHLQNKGFSFLGNAFLVP